MSRRRSQIDIRTEIWSCLSSLNDPSAFAFGGSFPSLPLPGLHVQDHGYIGLPLSSKDAEFIVSKAKPLLNTGDALADVQPGLLQIWELSNETVSLKNPQWDNGVGAIILAIYQGLDLKSGAARVKAEFCKLRLYEPGAFLQGYKQTTESDSDTFGTLAICLPSGHRGGRIVLKQAGKNYELDPQQNSDFDFSFSAHFDDVAYDVLPIEAGYRLELVYNLVQSLESSNHPSLSRKAIRGYGQQLSILLARYDTEVGKAETRLPHILIHPLKHKVTESYTKFEDLEGTDAQQCQALKQLLPVLGFDMYLATLKQEITTPHDSTDLYENDREGGADSEGETERTLSLEYIVTLDGFEIEKYDRDVDDEEILRPEPLGEEDCEDEEEIDQDYGHDIVQRSYHKVLVLVPSNRKMDFLVKFGDAQERILRELEDLRGRSSDDPDKLLHLPKLCELILAEPPTPPDLYSRYRDYNKYSERTYEPEIYQEVSRAALDIGRLDLFDKACAKTLGSVVLNNAAAMGSLLARTDMTVMRHRLNMGVKAAKTDKRLRSFLQEVETNLKNNLAESTQHGLEEFNNWQDEAFFLSITSSGGVNKTNGLYMVDVSTRMEWTDFEKNAKPLLQSGMTVGKTAFLNKLMLQGYDDLTPEQKRFVEWLIEEIWKSFSFHSDHVTDASTGSHQEKNTLLDGTDFLLLIRNTHSILSSFTLSQPIVPTILKAIPQASNPSIAPTSMSIARCLLSDDTPNLAPISEADKLSVEATCSSLLQIFLGVWILRTVGPSPVSPKNWSVPPKSCTCRDCSEVNRFLRSPVETVFELKAPEHRRKHLSHTFWVSSYYGYKRDDEVEPDVSWDMDTVKGRVPYTWRMTKHRRNFEKRVHNWRNRVQAAQKELAVLSRGKKTKLKTYLGDYYSVYMNADADRLPELTTIFPTTELSALNEAGVNIRSGLKRSMEADTMSEVTNKKSRPTLNGQYRDSMKENVAQDIEVIDLT